MKRRITILVVLVLGAALALLGQLARLQILAPERYVAWGQEQRRQSDTIEGVRGSITDRNGEELALSVDLPTVWTDPFLVQDPEETARRLAPVLQMSAPELRDLLDGPGRFAYLARTVEPEVGDRVSALDLDGVFIEHEPTRLRPGGDLALTVLGRVNPDQQGISGLERQFDTLLAGTPGTLVIETGRRGETIPQGLRELIPAEDGAGIELSIDRPLQFEVERALMAEAGRVCSSAGTVVMMEPATGEVLAMATIVRDEGEAGTPNAHYVVAAENRAVTSVYEPASVMKPFTFAGLLDQGKIRSDTALNVPGSIRIYDDDFVDEPVHEPEILTTSEILARSSNVGTILWAQELGEESLDSYLRRFGFGSTTAVGYPDESPGIFPALEDWTGTSLATIALGQGIAVTPLQVITGYNTIANGGTHVPPRLVRAVVDPDGERHENEGPPVERVISEQAASEVTSLLVGVVANGGTAWRAAVPGYSVAAKTGTARKVQDNGGYKDEYGNYHYVATVAGFFPASNPQLSMIVVLDEPSCGEYFASKVAAPLFGQLAGWALRHYGIAPDQEITEVAEPLAESPSDAASDESASAESGEGA